MSPAAAGETAMPSEEVPEAPRVTTGRVHALAAVAVPRAWDHEEVVEAVVVAAGGGVGRRPVEWKS